MTDQLQRALLLAFFAAGSLPIDAAAQAPATQAPATQAPANSLSAVVEDVRVISTTTDTYCGWPTLARRVSGELIVVYSGGREQHICPFGRVDMIRSRDDGESWTHPRTLLDGPIDDRDAGVLETSRGTLLVTTFTSLAYQPSLEKQNQLREALEQLEQDDPATDNVKVEDATQDAELNAETQRLQSSLWPDNRYSRWSAAHARLDAEARQAELGQWMIRSTDGGVTWSRRAGCLVNSPHGPIELYDGRLIYAGKELWTGQKRVGVCESLDDGVTWTWLSTIPTRAGDEASNYHELHAVQTESGRLIVHIRNHNATNNREILQCESDDGGRTWTTPHEIGVWGLPSHLLRLEDGRLLMTYGYRRMPYGIRARISHDDAGSWSDELIITHDGVGSDLGYPSTVEIDEGRLLTIWYERLEQSPRAVIRQAVWKINQGESGQTQAPEDHGSLQLEGE